MHKIKLTCRVCLSSESKNCVSLFIKHSNSIISETICAIANVKIQEGDKLPDKICSNCLQELDKAINFKIKCETSDKLLKSSYLDYQKPIKTEYGLVEDHIFKFDDIKKEPNTEDEHMEFAYSIDYYDDELNNLLIETDQKRKVNYDIQIVEPTVKNEEQKKLNRSKKFDNLCAKFECNECQNKFKSKCKLRVHWKKVHFYDQLICKLCNRAFKTCKAFNKHKKNPTKSCIAASRIKVEGTGAERTYQCKQCKYSTRSMTTMKTHLVTHTGEKNFFCTICPKRYSQLSGLTHHYGSHGILKEVICEVCGKHLKGSNIYRHRRCHVSNYVQCDQCKKMLKSKNSLIEHLKRHSNVKSYTCDKCAKTFYTIAELCTHRKNIHERGKHIYKCNYCDYFSLRASTLVKHKSRHTETNIPCTKCGKFFENEQTFTIHAKIHFAKRNYPCLYCEKKYMTRNSRSNHVVKFHKCRLLDNKSIKKE